MINLPDPLKSGISRDAIRPDHRTGRSAAQIVDELISLRARQARRQSVYVSIGAETAVPPRWLHDEPRASIQYAGHMATTAARDRRLTPQAKALLVVLRARCGKGTRTETCKTTLAHIIGVCTRSIGRYVADLVRFGYVEAIPRRGAGGLFTGLVVTITEKVLPAFRKLPWLAGWLAQNLPATGGNPDRTELSHTNHSFKESLFEMTAPPGQARKTVP